MAFDTIFSEYSINMESWIFNDKVAEVFQNMIYRSVPGYSNIVSMIGMIAKRFVQPNTQVYDLGCAIGEVTLSVLHNIQRQNNKIIAVDSSPAMINRCRSYISKYESVDIIEGDIRDINIQNASMVIMNFTLQFLSVNDRQTLLDRIYAGLNPGGVFILSEKFNFKDEKIDEVLSNLHYDFKRVNGYSEMEINKKRIILENTMITDSLETHEGRLHKAGFSYSGLWFQCFNFGSLISFK